MYSWHLLGRECIHLYCSLVILEFGSGCRFMHELAIRSICLNMFIPLSIKQNSRNFVYFLLSDGDDLAQYLDHLLATAVPQRGTRAQDKASGLGRFRAAANQTREIVCLVNKARDLQLHSELRLLVLKQFAHSFHPCHFFNFIISDVHMYLPTKLFRSPQPSLNLKDSSGPSKVYAH